MEGAPRPKLRLGHRHSKEPPHAGEHSTARGRVLGQARRHDAHRKAGHIAHEDALVAVVDDPPRGIDGHQAEAVAIRREAILCR